MSELTHWKKLQNPNYLGAYSLQPGEEPILTITKVGLEMVVGTDGKKDECTVAHFKENVKPMILNATNCKTINKICGTPYIEKWEGQKIQVFATTVKAFGDEVEALRIRPKAPISKKPVLNPEYKGWDAAMEALKNGETSIQFLMGKYDIPPESLALLETANA